ncbi:MAG: thioether cross-link-forming SCIFF peptide maturase [Bacillota bacterium]
MHSLVPQVHVFRVNEAQLALDVGSNNVFVLDDAGLWAVWRIASQRGFRVDGSYSPPQQPPPGAEQALAEARSLVEQGLLFTDDPGDLAAEFLASKRGKHGPRALCLNIAHACNMRCSYCFAGSGTYDGSAGIMSPEVAERAIDFLLEGSPGKQCEVDFFGGEPLLAWETLTHAIEYGKRQASRKGKRLRFTCTTNGSLLTGEKLAFLDENRVALVVSLDGRPQVHDRMRRTASGEGSFNQCLCGAELVLKSRGLDNGGDEGYGSMGSYYIRGTYTAFNLDFCEDVRYLVGLGFKRVSLEPVVAHVGEEHAITPDHLDAVAAEYDRLALYYTGEALEGRPFQYFHYELKLSDGPCVSKRLSGCGAGVEYMAVSPDGRLWPCHQFDGRSGYCLGDVWQGVINRELHDRFRGLTVLSKEECRECWARYLCGGGCHANAQEFTGSLEKPWQLGCEIQKIRLERALYVQAKKQMK